MTKQDLLMAGWHTIWEGDEETWVHEDFDLRVPLSVAKAVQKEWDKKMTTEKMPDVIWASRRPQDVGDRWTGPYKCYDDQTKYFRAETVEELLKSIRDQVEFCKKHDSTPALDKTMELIDNFLENNTK